jgi:two-component system, sensor histidine kinase and response regulator
MNQMAVFNRELALERVGGDVELLDEIVVLFLGEYPGLLEQIQSAINAGDAKELFRSAHTLKGSLSALGAEAAQKQAMELEMSGRHAELSDTSTMLADLEHLLQQLRDELIHPK